MNCTTHPTVELTGYEDDLTCPWCDEVQNLASQIKSLRECIDKTAIKIYRGNQTIHLSGDIGLLEINSGSVTVHNSLSNPVSVPVGGRWIYGAYSDDFPSPSNTPPPASSEVHRQEPESRHP